MTWHHLAGLLLASALTCSTCLDLNVDPSGFTLVTEDTNMTVTLSLQSNDTSPFDLALFPPEAVFSVTVIPDEEWKLDFVNKTAQFTAEEIETGCNKSIVLSGYYWGRTQLSFYLTVDSINETILPNYELINGSLLRDDISIGVSRAFSIVDKIFMTFITVFISVNTINMGAQLNLQIIKECVKKPLGPICGFISQFGFMPPFSYWMGYLFFTNPLYRLGLFVIGCSPGGVMSNFWTLIYDGDINLSITMTFISTIAAMGMMPLWMFTLGKNIVEGNENLKIPYQNLAISLVSLTVPLAIGLIIQYKRPVWAEKLSKIVKPLTLGIVLFILTVGIYNSWKILMLMTIHAYAAGFLVAISGFSFGAIFASAFCLKKPQIIAVCIETGMQNIGVAFIVLKLSLPNPDGDVGSLPAIAQGILTAVCLQSTYWVSTVIKRFFCRSSTGKEAALKVEETPNSPEDVEVVKSLMENVEDNQAIEPKAVIVTQLPSESNNSFSLLGLSNKK